MTSNKRTFLPNSGEYKESNNCNSTIENNSINSVHHTRLISLTCSKCGGELNLDLNNLQSFCPYCGEKVMIDTDQLGSILAEKEETKRHQMDVELEEKKEVMAHEERKRNEKISTMMILGLIILSLILLFSSGIGGSGKKKMNEQIEKLDNLVVEIKTDIDNGDYYSARYKANQLYYVDTGWSSNEDGLVTKWDNIREDTLEMIDEVEAEAEAKDKTANTSFETGRHYNSGGLFLQLFYEI